MIYLQLFWEFFKVGLFSVGGGLATLPFLYDISAKTGWFTTTDIADMVAVSESTPGPLGINMATYVGHKTAGVTGGIVATLGLIAPAIVVIMIIARILTAFKEAKVVQDTFYGLRPASTGLIAAAGLGVAKIALLRIDLFRQTGSVLSLFNWKLILFRQTGSVLSLFNWKLILLAAVIYITLVKFRKHPILYIAAAAAAGIIFQL